MIESEGEKDSKNERRHRFKVGVRIVLSLLLLVGTGISFITDPSRRITAEQLFAVAFVLFILLFDEVQEFVVGPFLKIRREMHEVKQEQARISQTLKNIFEVRAEQKQQVFVGSPGASEEQAKQLVADLEKARTEHDEMAKELELTKQQAQVQQQNTKQLQDASEEAKARLSEAQRQVVSLLDIAEKWEFKYLDQFLVYNTKLLLHRARQKGEMPLPEFLMIANSMGIATENLNNVFRALFEHKLIRPTVGTVAVTEKAARFLDYIGFKEQPGLSGLGEFISALLQKSKDESGIKP